MTDTKSFEATYPQYPFAPLVRFGMAVAAWLTRRARTGSTTRGAGGVMGGSQGAAA